jgi:hypothetical protein
MCNSGAHDENMRHRVKSFRRCNICGADVARPAQLGGSPVSARSFHRFCPGDGHSRAGLHFCTGGELAGTGCHRADPHPHSGTGRGDGFPGAHRRTARSLACRRRAHPIRALAPGPALARPAHGAADLRRPAFLAITAALGLACTISWRRSSSIWPAVALHWAVVVMWKGLAGG